MNRPVPKLAVSMELVEIIEPGEVARLSVAVDTIPMGSAVELEYDDGFDCPSEAGLTYLKSVKAAYWPKSE